MKMSVLVTYTFLLLLDVSRALVPVVVRHGNLQRPRPLRMQELGSTREEGAASDPPGLPPFLASRISFQTGGFKQPNQEEETLILWNTFKKCYATEADAEAAVNKTSMTVNPSMNSPSKISGTFALLKARSMVSPGDLVVVVSDIRAGADGEGGDVVRSVQVRRVPE